MKAAAAKAARTGRKAAPRAPVSAKAPPACYTDDTEGYTDYTEGFADYTEGFADYKEGFTDYAEGYTDELDSRHDSAAAEGSHGTTPSEPGCSEDPDPARPCRTRPARLQLRPLLAHLQRHHQQPLAVRGRAVGRYTVHGTRYGPCLFLFLFRAARCAHRPATATHGTATRRATSGPCEPCVVPNGTRWCCSLLAHVVTPARATRRRLKQHRGELRGGAKSTRTAKDW
jgi:hypothetical protein